MRLELIKATDLLRRCTPEAIEEAIGTCSRSREGLHHEPFSPLSRVLVNQPMTNSGFGS